MTRLFVEQPLASPGSAKYAETLYCRLGHLSLSPAWDKPRPLHCLIVKCLGMYKQQKLSNSWTRKFDKKVLQEQFLWIPKMLKEQPRKPSEHAREQVWTQIFMCYFSNFPKKLSAGAEISNFSSHPAQRLIWLVFFFASLGPGTK